MNPVHYLTAALICFAAAGLFAWSRERIRAERAWALYRAHIRAQAVSSGQVWIVNDRPLFILRTDAEGVQWSIQHPLSEDYTPQQTARYETWGDWRRRLEHSDMFLTTREWGGELDQ